MKKIIIIFCLLTTFLESRETGQTEITTEEGIEVYQKEKYYLLKKNVVIISDNFNLKAQEVKAYFNKDLYDITDIYSRGSVTLNSNQGLEAIGNQIDYNVVNQDIHIEGEKSLLQNNKFIMKSNGSIDLKNITGEFKLFGTKSQLIANDVNITGEKIKGKYVDVDGENIVEKLSVEDKKQINIKTETLNMFALRAELDKQKNIIELFENVRIYRGQELITGDYAKINTLDESYKITSKKSKKVKVLLKRADE